MRKVFFASLFFVGMALPCTVMAQDSYVDGYYNNSGTYVQPHYRSAPDGNPYNNYSTQGNTNPYTGTHGTQTPNSYSSPQNFGNSYGGGGSFGTPHQSMGGGVKPGRLR